jgi:serine phosphatase RsbU (regulator of sigma subunit)
LAQRASFSSCLLEQVAEALHRHIAGRDQFDDITLLSVQRKQ